MDPPIKKLILFFQKVSFIIRAHSAPLRNTLYAGRLKHFAEASEFFTHAHTLCFSSSSSAKRRHRTASFGGWKGWKSEGAKSGLWVG
jgi:hypothetical protein